MPALSLQSITSAFDALQKEADALKQLTGTSLNSAIVELKDKILDARMAQLTALEHIHELEKKLGTFEDWESEKRRYQLQQFPPGVSLHSLKPEIAAGEPLHQICPACYQQHKASILQSTNKVQYRRRFRICPICKFELAYGSEEPTTRPGSAVTEYDPFGH